jgi:tetratricopeptide (TPR) repeat protein
MKYLHKLTEQSQFSVKHAYYFQLRNEPEMSLDIAKNWAELYPDDLGAQEILGIRYMILGQKENELAAYKKIVSLDPNQYEYILKIGQIYKGQGKFEESLEYYRLYADKFPNNAKSFTQLGDLYRVYGDYEEARTYYKKALLIEPEDITVELSLARIKTELGEFAQGLEDYQEILEKCSSPMEKNEVYKRMESHFFLRGQLEKGIESMENKFTEREKYDAPINILTDKIDVAEKYIMIGRKDTALQIVETLEHLGPPLDHVATLGYLIIYLELENTDSIEKYLPVFAKHIEEKQFGVLQNLEFYARARLYELKGEYDHAIREYTKVLEFQPVSKDMHYHIGRCFRKQKEFREAEDHLLEILGVHPFKPDELYELGLVYAEWGKEEKALEYLNRAVSVWEEADPEYEPAINAKELLTKLESVSP